MAKRAAAAKGPNMDTLLAETGDAVTPEEEAELAQEAKGETPEPEVEGAEPQVAKPAENRVPLPRFQQVEQERDTARKEAQEYRERWARFEERQKISNEALQRAQEADAAARAAKERPDAELDPAGARAYDAEQRAARAEAAVNQLTQQFQGAYQQVQGGFQQQQFESWVVGEVGNARRQLADYDARVDFARKARSEFWGKMYPPEVAKDIVAREEIALLNGARERGIPLHTLIPALADQWGYKAPNGAAPRQVQPQAMPNAGEKIRQIQNGQAVQGLGRVQSGEAQQLQNWQTMDPNEFAGYVANMDEDEFMDKTQDPQTGKMFNQKVAQLG